MRNQWIPRIHLAPGAVRLTLILLFTALIASAGAVDRALSSDAETGKALPKDGGEPGKVYRAYLKAVKDKDVAVFRQIVMDPEVQKASDEELKGMFEFVAMASPPEPKITKGYVQGDKAVLYLEGKMEGEMQYGIVKFARDKKTWRIVKVSWSNTPPEK